MKKGIESLRKSVLDDTKNGQNCFSENGCTYERYKKIPQEDPAMLNFGKYKCVANTKCFHDYCGKYKWILDRAKHYADFTGKTVDEILEAWESKRTYWYMNYYQEANQPLLHNVTKYEDWIQSLEKRFGKDSKKWAFKCPACGNVQTIQDFIDHNIEHPEERVYYSCMGRYINKKKGCDWTLGGFLNIHKQTILKDLVVVPVFEMAD